MRTTPMSERDEPMTAEESHVASSLLRQRFQSAAYGAFSALLNTIYPPQCIGCRAATGEPSTLCPRCWSSIRFIERPFCERLGTPFEIDLGGPLLSPQAIAEPPVFERARSAVLYDGLGRALVHRLKYGDRHDLALAMARLMQQAGRDVLAEANLIIPVPLHWTRLLQRRFNQAAILSRTLAGLTGLKEASDVLVRVKRTRPQYGLTRAERQLNLQGALRIKDGRAAMVEGRRILLVDDVMTTSSTANAAARALLKAKAAQVDVLTFARVAGSS